jgi:hypothetical protein
MLSQFSVRLILQNTQLSDHSKYNHWILMSQIKRLEDVWWRTGKDGQRIVMLLADTMFLYWNLQKKLRKPHKYIEKGKLDHMSPIFTASHGMAQLNFFSFFHVQWQSRYYLHELISYDMAVLKIRRVKRSSIWLSMLQWVC